MRTVSHLIFDSLGRVGCEGRASRNHDARHNHNYNSGCWPRRRGTKRREDLPVGLVAVDLMPPPCQGTYGRVFSARARQIRMYMMAHQWAGCPVSYYRHGCECECEYGHTLCGWSMAINEHVQDHEQACVCVASELNCLRAASGPESIAFKQQPLLHRICRDRVRQAVRIMCQC